MRASALVFLSLFAAAAAHPHTPPLHNRHNGIVRRQTNGTEDDVKPSPTAVVPSPSPTTTTTTSTTQLPTSESTTTPTGTTTKTEDEVKPTPTSTRGSTTTTASSSATEETSAESTAQASSAAESLAPSTDAASASTQSTASAVGSALTQKPTSVTASSATEVEYTVTSTNSLGKPVIVSNKSVVRPSASGSKAASEEDTKSGGISKGALIAIIVVASVVGGAAIIWTLFRKWKLRPSNRFDERMRPIDFSPNNDRDMNDDFLEKTLQRSASVTSADRQRQQFVADLDHPGNHSLTAGVPDHDFTAGGGPAQYNHYDPDPYEYDQYGRPAANPNAVYDFSSPRADGVHPDLHSDQGHAQQYDYPAMPEPSHAMYPPQQPGVTSPTADFTSPTHTGGNYYTPDYPTQDHANHTAGPDDGYSNLQRGPSVGHAQVPYPPPHSGAPFDPLGGNDFSIAGRPTGGADAGPYAQAAAFRY